MLQLLNMLSDSERASRWWFWMGERWRWIQCNLPPTWQVWVIPCCDPACPHCLWQQAGSEESVWQEESCCACTKNMPTYHARFQYFQFSTQVLIWDPGELPSGRAVTEDSGIHNFAHWLLILLLFLFLASDRTLLYAKNSCNKKENYTGSV